MLDMDAKTTPTVYNLVLMDMVRGTGTSGRGITAQVKRGYKWRPSARQSGIPS